jgi:hypothetical protein
MIIALQLLNSLSALACFLIVIRLITFKKGDKRYRFFISLVAWLIINASASIALWLIFAGFTSIFPALLVTAFLYAVAIKLIACRGNVAALFYMT